MAPVLNVDPRTLLNANDPGWSHCTWRLLAEGDSWFSIGALNLVKSANLLHPMAFSEAAGLVQLAYPGDTLRHMSEVRADPRLELLLTGNVSWRWSGILLSCGGNDLIDATQVPPQRDSKLRIVRDASEWGPASEGAARYINDAGWQTFANYFKANLDLIVKLRDKKAGPNGNKGRPIFMHTYAYPTPRPAGAGMGAGPWLMPSMVAYGIPKADWIALAQALVDRLAELLLACAADSTRYPALHVFDSRKLVSIAPAALDTTGESGDWLNEIHLTAEGCRKLTSAWCSQIESVLRQSP